MTSAFPGGLDSFTNPTGASNQGTAVGGRTHSAMHADINDAVEAVQSALGVNLANVKDVRVFDAVKYGALVDGSTNDTAAWQAAINAAATAGGGVVTSSKNGVSVISGALQDTSGANAQLTLPQVDYVDGEPISIVLAGLTPAPSILSVIGTTVVPDNHLVLKSTLSSGTGSVIGAVGPSGTFGEFTSLHLHLENLTVRTVANPTLTGLDLHRVAAVSIGYGVVVDTGSYDVDALAQPTSSGSYGIRLPGNNNGAQVDIGRLDVVGFYTGVQHSEHLNADHLVTWGCRVGLETNAGNHASHIKRFMAVHCTTPWKATGAHAIDVDQFDLEHANSSQGWRQTTYDIDDASNYLSTFVRWWSVLAGTGAHNVFTKNGGSGVTTSRVGAAFGGAAQVYEHRDRLVAAAGNTTLTLGATPVAGSPQVWVNGSIKWPGTDYTISGAVVSFGSALSASDVVLAHYRSTTSTYTAAALTSPAVNIVDNFNRANSTSSLGTTSTGGATWVQTLGTWGIVSNKAYLATGTNAQHTCYVESSASDCTVSVKIYPITSGAGRYYGLWFRSDGAGNGYILQVSHLEGTIGVLKRTAGSNSSVGTAVAYSAASGDTIAVVLSGSSIVVKVNGTTMLTTSDATYQTGTKHGLWCYTEHTTTTDFDDFSIQP